MFRNTHRTAGQNAGRAVVRRPLSVVGGRWPQTIGDGPRISFRLPPSPFRLGISLTEVLIAMGILTVGLLGVAAIFPVGSFFMQRGEIADNGSAVAQAAFNDMHARGMFNPDRWLTWEDALTPPNLSSGAPKPLPWEPNFYTRRWAASLRQQLAYQSSSPPASEAIRQKQNALEFGSVFVIDPLGIASVAQPGVSNPGFIRSGSAFPLSKAWSSGLPPVGGSPTPPPCWNPWLESSTNPTHGVGWPVRRITLAQSITPASASAPPYRPLDAPVAQRMFSSRDDLSLDLPTAQNKPATQMWRLANLDGSGDKDDPIGRQTRGNYSWLATVVPTTPEGRDALATNPAGHAYEVSVVVFYKRPVGVLTPKSGEDDLRVANVDLLKANERAAGARIISTGLNGGEVLLTRFNPGGFENSDSPFTNLKVGNWIMLCGPHPGSTAERPLMVSRWYRVLAIEGKDERLDADGQPTTDASVDVDSRRIVSLRGPQWPWQPETYSNAASNWLYACIPSGAVAVHSKTIHLEGNSVWNGGGLTSR